MTTISLADWTQSPDIVMGKDEHKRLTIVALTDLGERGDNTDFLLYELDRAHLVPDSMLPSDVVRLGSMVRYRPMPGPERTVKLVMPDAATEWEGYRLSVTSEHGAALIGTRPGHIMTWVSPEGAMQRLEVIKVANSGPTPPDPDDDPGPLAA
jgi:regulator of nucleoside diphosphate kinase